MSNQVAHRVTSQIGHSLLTFSETFFKFAVAFDSTNQRHTEKWGRRTQRVGVSIAWLSELLAALSAHRTPPSNPLLHPSAQTPLLSIQFSTLSTNQDSTRGPVCTVAVVTGVDITCVVSLPKQVS